MRVAAVAALSHSLYRLDQLATEFKNVPWISLLNRIVRAMASRAANHLGVSLAAASPR